jgi:hypothetical protein
LSDKGGCSNNVLDFNTIDYPLENKIHRLKNHPSIIAIKEKIISGSFDFKPLTVEEVSTEIFKMNKKRQILELYLLVLAHLEKFHMRYRNLVSWSKLERKYLSYPSGKPILTPVVDFF